MNNTDRKSLFARASRILLLSVVAITVCSAAPQLQAAEVRYVTTVRSSAGDIAKLILKSIRVTLSHLSPGTFGFYP